MQIQQRKQVKDSELGEEVHPVLRRIYAARGVVNEADLRLELGELLPPSQLKNCHTAADLLLTAMYAGKKILVVGDFDADGATSSALLVLCMRAFGYDFVDYLVPNRFQYGYGLTPEIVEVALESLPDLIITVENGISSIEGVRQANKAGVDVLVTDHHLPGAELPEASCILNPNQPGCEFPSKALAGVGVVFYLMSSLRSALREQLWFESRGIAEPNMASFLDLVALGTVADVVPLDQNNRRLVKHGLGIIRSGKGRPGIRALLEVAGRNPNSVVANDLAFGAGPRLNAAGRLDDMSLGIECLLTDNPGKARELAVRLDGLNKDRRQIEQEMQAQAMDALQHLDMGDVSQLGICLYDSHWHQGVIGILASRIKEKFHRPCIVFADAGEESDANMIKGSARSIEGLHIRDVLDAVATTNPGLLNRFGGHAMAAGLAIHREDFEAFRAAFEKVLKKYLDQSIPKESTWVDGELPPSSLTLDFAASLREAGPWGQHFPEPQFMGDFIVINNRVVGEKHLKLTLQAGEPKNPEAIVDAIAFNVDKQLLNLNLKQVSLVYRLDVNEFRGVVTSQLVIEKIVGWNAR
ncbi:MAG: single-stranded-DNA-specific exonuclease RecJ [Gammaproteobacteria bacterium]